MCSVTIYHLCYHLQIHNLPEAAILIIDLLNLFLLVARCNIRSFHVSHIKFHKQIYYSFNKFSQELLFFFKPNRKCSLHFSCLHSEILWERQFFFNCQSSIDKKG